MSAITCDVRHPVDGRACTVNVEHDNHHCDHERDGTVERFRYWWVDDDGRTRHSCRERCVECKEDTAFLFADGTRRDYSSRHGELHGKILAARARKAAVLDDFEEQVRAEFCEVWGMIGEAYARDRGTSPDAIEAFYEGQA